MKRAAETRRLAITRRRWLGLGLGALCAGFCAACAGEPIRGETWMTREREEQKKRRSAAAEGHLLARPAVVRTTGERGLRKLKLDARRDTLLYVPPGYTHERPAPLALMLHGAGGDAHHGLSLLQTLAERLGIILVAPASRQATWDVIADRYGEDVALVDRALTETFKHYAVDTKRLAIGAFSDGASYALSLGITNGELFSHVLAFSPGFMRPTRQQGAPRLFISHGRADRVLPIDACSRRIVGQVQGAGYDVIYREFEGGHIIPPDIAQAAINWLID